MEMAEIVMNPVRQRIFQLNPNHPIGASKAKFMKEILGYSQEDARSFHKNIVSAIIGKVPTKSEQTKYGIKHTYNTIHRMNQIRNQAMKTVHSTILFA